MSIRKFRPQIADAINRKSRIRIIYHSLEGVKDRVIEPWYVFKWSQYYYIIGYCHLEKGIRTFNMSRIIDTEELFSNSTQNLILFSEIVKIKEEENFLFFSIDNIIMYHYPDNVVCLRDLVKIRIKLHGKAREEAKIKPGKFPKRILLSKMDKQSLVRSPLEEYIIHYLNSDSDVIKIDVEPFNISYVHNRIYSKYKPDLLVEYKDGRKELIEVKLRIDSQNKKNQAKYAAAEEYCNDNNLIFKILGVEGESRTFADGFADWSELDISEITVLD